MRTLYESILDDEEVLVTDTKKQLKNWVVALKNLMKKSSRKDILNFLNGEFVANEFKSLVNKYGERMYWECPERLDYKMSCELRDKKAPNSPTPIFAAKITHDDPNVLKIFLQRLDHVSPHTGSLIKEKDLIEFKKKLMKYGCKYGDDNEYYGSATFLEI